LTNKTFLETFSKHLKELQEIALCITKDNSISVQYSTQIKTACYSCDKNLILLTSNGLPKGIENFPRAHAKLLDALTSHECGHALLTNPLEDRYRRFENAKRYQKLAEFIVNIIEDKRIDYFIILRYRLDLGKRLEFLNRLETESIEKTLASAFDKKNPNLELNRKLAQLKLNEKNIKASLLLSAIVNKGLYSATYPRELESLYDLELKKDLAKCLDILESVKYQRVTHDLIKSAETIYNTIEKHIDKSENSDNAQKGLGSLIPNILENGELIVFLTKEQLRELEVNEKSEDKKEKQKEEAKKQLEDLQKGLGCGMDKGSLIHAPEPNFSKYAELVQRNSNEIQRLLNKLKRTVKPIVQRALFQRRGRFMNGMLSKAYTSSLSREVTNCYQSSNMAFEKQKVALEILIDFSGSMDYEDSINVCTILSEVFGNWLEDKAFSILCFASNFIKIKTFFESYQNTKARIGNISIGCNTNVIEPLEVSLKLFNTIGEPRQKLFVLVSDFQFGSQFDRANEILEQYSKYGIKLLFIGLDNSYDMNRYLPNSKNVFRTTIQDVKTLPEMFVDIYLLASETIIK